MSSYVRTSCCLFSNPHTGRAQLRRANRTYRAPSLLSSIRGQLKQSKQSKQSDSKFCPSLVYLHTYQAETHPKQPAGHPNLLKNPDCPSPSRGTLNTYSTFCSKQCCIIHGPCSYYAPVVSIDGIAHQGRCNRLLTRALPFKVD